MRAALSIWAACAALLGSGAAAAEPFVACRDNRPGDAGLRVLVEAVFRNDANTLAVQRQLGLPPTPVSGGAGDVDELAWCRCVHERRVARLGEEIAVAMASSGPRGAAKYDAWLKGLGAQQQLAHVAFLFTTDAECVNQSRRR